MDRDQMLSKLLYNCESHASCNDECCFTNTPVCIYHSFHSLSDSTLEQCCKALDGYLSIDDIVITTLEDEIKAKVEAREEVQAKLASDITEDMVNHPSHYNQHSIEVIDFIEDWNLDFNIGNVVKYCARAPYKSNELEDLKKAKFYLERAISRLEVPNE